MSALLRSLELLDYLADHRAAAVLVDAVAERVKQGWRIERVYVCSEGCGGGAVALHLGNERIVLHVGELPDDAAERDWSGWVRWTSQRVRLA